MKLSNIKYYLSQSFKSVIRNGLMSFTSIFTVTCCLIILGIFLLMSINVTYIADQVQNQCEIQAFVKDGASSEEVSKIGEEIKNLHNIREAVLFTKHDALQYMREIFGENASALDGLEKDNPFRDSYKITLNDLALSADVIAAVGAIDGVEKVENKQSLMENIFSVTTAIKYSSFWIMLILGIVSIFIIANTIKLAVFSRRKEINIMKFVGATDWFIRWPFIIEGIIIGFIGGLLAFSLISWGYMLAMSSISSYNLDMFRLKVYSDIWLQLLMVFFGLGALIGAAGSFLSIRKHLQV